MRTVHPGYCHVLSLISAAVVGALGTAARAQTADAGAAGAERPSADQIPADPKDVFDPMVPPPVGPRGGGNDECGSAVVLAGSPVTIFQNANNATPEPRDRGMRRAWPSTPATSTTTSGFSGSPTPRGVAVLRSCGGGTIDTKAAVWDGAACPPSSIVACNDGRPAARRASFLSSSSRGTRTSSSSASFPGLRPARRPGTLTGPATPVGSDRLPPGARSSAATAERPPPIPAMRPTPPPTWRRAPAGARRGRRTSGTHTSPAVCGVSTFSFCPSEDGSASNDTLLEAYNRLPQRGAARGSSAMTTVAASAPRSPSPSPRA